MKLVTHNGTFHADEVLSTAVLCTIYTSPETTVTRTRDMDVIDAADIVYDVGNVYDPAKKRFDHHMVDSPTRDNLLAYSSAGLIWKFYGHEFLVKVLQESSSQDVRELSTNMGALSEFWKNLDRWYFIPADKIDNGLHQGPVRQDDLAGIASSLNTPWYEDETDDGFFTAVDIFTKVLRAAVAKSAGRFLAKDVVRHSETLFDGKVLKLSKSVPWTSVVKKEFPEVCFVLNEKASGDWLLQTIPTDETFVVRYDLPEAWAGKSSELSEVINIPGCIFCHKGRFIAANTTYDGAYEMARLALIDINKL